MNPVYTTIVIAAFGVLFSIIGYFVIRYFKQTDKSNDKLQESNDRLNDTVGKLQISITALNGTMLAQESRFDTFSGTCRDNHLKIDKRLEGHGVQIDDHEKRIVKIETKL